jgi:hypothetical protein
MAKRKRALTENTLKRRKKEGRCIGDGKDYIPWLKVQDVASLGVSLKTFSYKTSRQHHLLSRLESQFFYIVEWSDKITDIKEQFVLDINETIEIANELCIKHPKDPVTKVLAPMSTDFLLIQKIDGKQKLFARTVKYSKDLNKKRVLEKFDIEKTYWKRRNIDWGIITEDDINPTLVSNIIWVRKARTLMGIDDLNIDLIIKIELDLRNEIYRNNMRISKISSMIDTIYCLEEGTSLFVVRFLIANKIWIVNMYEPINNPNSIINLQEINLNILYAMKG